MKKLLVLFLFMSVLMNAQSWNYKRSAEIFSGGLLRGGVRGINQTIEYHYSKFQKVHPNADPKFWNPAESWKMKYVNFDAGDTRERYFGSKTFLAWTTDAKHLTDVLNTGLLVGTTLKITLGEKRKWWEYGIDMGLMFAGSAIGFWGVYNVIYK